MNAIYVLSHKGEMLSGRTFRGACFLEKFRTHVLLARGPPVVVVDGICLVHVKYEDMYVVVVGEDVACALELCKRIILMGVRQFGQFTEEIVREKVLDVYFMMDSIVDYGFVLPDTVTLVPHKKHVVYVNVRELVNVFVSGNVTAADITGIVRVSPFLSGFPECKLGLKHNANSFVYHQCVKLSDQTNEVSFVPPNSDFELLRYKANLAQPPFKIESHVYFERETKLEYKITLSTCFPPTVDATNVVIRIPTPTTTIRVNGLGFFADGAGKAKYKAEENCIVWKISKISGGNELVFNAEADLQKTKKWVRPPIDLEFSISMYAASGLRIEFLRISEESKATKWIRYLTTSGRYQIKIK